MVDKDLVQKASLALALFNPQDFLSPGWDPFVGTAYKQGQGAGGRAQLAGGGIGLQEGRPMREGYSTPRLLSSF